MLFDCIGGLCSKHEINRLVNFYKSYHLPHRQGFLDTLLDGTLHTAIAKVTAVGEKPESLTPQQWGAHNQWIGFKYRRLAIRILFLRYTQDQKMKPAQARKTLFKQFKGYGISTYDTIYRATKFKGK